jgi:hypothetical protein
MRESTAVPRPLTSTERAVLSRYLANSGIPERDTLSAQIPYTTVVGGHAPTIDLAVDSLKAQPAHIEPRGPLQPRMFAVGPNDELWGEIMVWVTEGYLSGLGLAWWDEDRPRSWDSIDATKYDWELPAGT